MVLPSLNVTCLFHLMIYRLLFIMDTCVLIYCEFVVGDGRSPAEHNRKDVHDDDASARSVASATEPPTHSVRAPDANGRPPLRPPGGIHAPAAVLRQAAQPRWTEDHESREAMMEKRNCRGIRVKISAATHPTDSEQTEEVLPKWNRSSFHSGWRNCRQWRNRLRS